MSGGPETCRHLSHADPEPSPFDRILILGWYDGPEEGLAHCGACDRDYLFKAVGFINEDSGVRLYRLSELPENAMQTVVEALSPYMQPRWPLWAPLWNFPSDSIRAGVDDLIDRVLSSAGPVCAVIVASELDKEILLARAVSPREASQVEDWGLWIRSNPAACARQQV
jgi:hypothetical protein